MLPSMPVNFVPYPKSSANWNYLKLPAGSIVDRWEHYGHFPQILGHLEDPGVPEIVRTDIDWNFKISDIFFVINSNPLRARVFFIPSSQYMCMDFDPNQLILK